ncbi:MAG: IS110 family transposase, partial [Mesorhizobium sp.]
MSLRNAPRPAAIYGVDIGKNVFHVVGLDSGGEPIQRARFRRDIQWIARRLQALGHKVRLIPAQFVKP